MVFYHFKIRFEFCNNNQQKKKLSIMGFVRYQTLQQAFATKLGEQTCAASKPIRGKVTKSLYILFIGNSPTGLLGINQLEKLVIVPPEKTILNYNLDVTFNL